MKIHYPTRLPTIGVTLLQAFTRAKDTHSFQCTTCQHIWETTPRAIIQSSDKYNTNSCPNCKHIRNYSQKQAENKAKIPSHIEVLSEWDGNRNFQGAEGKVLFRNNKCGHEFESYPNYIIAGKSECTVCGKEQRIAEMIIRRESERVYDDPEKWLHYVSLVDKFTRRTYKAHKSVINPLDLPRGRNGTTGKYQLDHIVSKIEGFTRNISPERLSQVDNLQMLSWEENIAKKEKLLWIPLTFREYFANTETA